MIITISGQRSFQAIDNVKDVYSLNLSGEENGIHVKYIINDNEEESIEMHEEHVCQLFSDNGVMLQEVRVVESGDSGLENK